MKRLLIALALFLIPSLAMAQCNGVFPNNTACGNVTGAPNTPRPIPLTNFPANAPGGTIGQIQTNAGGGLFGGFTMSGSCTIDTTTGIITCIPGNFAVRIVSSTPVTMIGADGEVVVNVASAAAVTLPPSPTVGRPYLIKDGACTASVNNITITPAAGNIDGKTNYVLSANCGAIQVIYNGIQWNIL